MWNRRIKDDGDMALLISSFKGWQKSTEEELEEETDEDKTSETLKELRKNEQDFLNAISHLSSDELKSYRLDLNQILPPITSRVGTSLKIHMIASKIYSTLNDNFKG